MLADFTMSGEIGEINGAPIGFALQLEYQTQEYKITPSAGRLDDEQFGGDNAIDFIQALLDTVAEIEKDIQSVLSLVYLLLITSRWV